MTAQLFALLLTFAPAPAPVQPPKDSPPASGPTDAAQAPVPKEPIARLEVPLFDDAFADVPVAKAWETVITLRDVRDAIAAAHQDAGGMTGMVAKRDAREVLDRLINIQLLVAEAREMGLDELEEVQKELARHRDSALLELVRREAVRDVKPDPQEVEDRVRLATREWKVLSALFPTEEAAKALLEEVKGGRTFVEAIAAAVADGRASGGKEEFFAAKKLAPEVVGTLNGLHAGEVSGPIKVGNGYTVLLWSDARFSEDPQERALAEQASLERLKREKLQKYADDLRKKYTKLDKKLLDGLDYHSKKRFEAFAKDKRPLVRIQGEKPITVAELTAALRGDAYHGIDAPIREKRFNGKKWTKLESMIVKRLHAKEAKRLKLAETVEYRRKVAEHERTVLFGVFLKRVIVPGLEVLEKDAKAYYDANLAEFSSPRMFRLDAVALPDPKAAQATLAKLQQGTDLGWVKANTPDQLDPEKRTIELQGNVVTESNLPEELANALAGAKRGDFRLFAAQPGEQYVVAVLDAMPPEPLPYVEARAIIANKLFSQKLDGAVKDYAAKLREATSVKYYLTSLGD